MLEWNQLSWLEVEQLFIHNVQQKYASHLRSHAKLRLVQLVDEKALKCHFSRF